MFRDCYFFFSLNMVYSPIIFFVLKNVSSCCIFSKNTYEFDIVLTKIVNISTTNELVKLTKT